MTRIHQLTPEFVEYIPERPVPGVLYVSQRYGTAMHLCCCGCGNEVVTPLNPAKWRLTGNDATVSLYPSIGNWSFPCQSHYWITGNRVRWAAAMAPEVIVVVKERDRKDAAAVVPVPIGSFARVRRAFSSSWTAISRLLSR